MAKHKSGKAFDPSISIQEMLNRLPRGSVGEFDMISGVIYIDCAEAEYEELSAKRKRLGTGWDTGLSPRERLLVETSMHEYYHYLQVLSCGYVTETVLALLDSLQAAVNRFKQDGVDEVRLAAYARLAERVLGPLSVRDSPAVLAPLDLIEGPAYHFQCRALAVATDHNGMLQALKRPGLDPVYRRAYERATQVLGARAFRAFPLCASAALMFDDPPAAYEELLAGMVGKERRNQPSFGEKLEAIGERHAFIGSATDVRRLRGESVFPWYEKPLSWVAKSKSTPPALFDSADQKLLGKLVPPLVFRDSFRGDLGIQTMFALLASQASLRFTLPYVDPSATSKRARSGRAAARRRDSTRAGEGGVKRPSTRGER